MRRASAVIVVVLVLVVMVLVVMVLGGLALAGSDAGAQTGSELGPCTAVTGTQDAGSVSVGQRLVIRLTPTCVFTSGATVLVMVNGTAVGSRTADASGVSLTLTALSATERSGSRGP